MTKKITLVQSSNLISYKESIKEVFPHLSNREVVIFDSANNLPRFKELKTNKEINKITEILGIWCAYLGANVTAPELVFINQFIRDKFPNLNIEDLKDLVDLIGISEIKTKYHGNFTPIYVGQCIAEYRPIRANIIFKIKSQIQLIVNQTQVLPKLNPQDSFKIWKEHMLIAKSKSNTLSYIDNGNLIYNFLIKENLLNFTIDLITKATKYANKQISLEKLKKKGKGLTKTIKLNETQHKLTEKSYKRQYAVNQWLRSMKLNEFKEFLDTYNPENKNSNQKKNGPNYNI